MLSKCFNMRDFYTAACMSPALNGSSDIQCFERSDAIKIRNGAMFIST